MLSSMTTVMLFGDPNCVGSRGQTHVFAGAFLFAGSASAESLGRGRGESEEESGIISNATFLVGAAGFEPTTPSPPDWCANRAAPRPDRNGADYRDALPRTQLFHPAARVLSRAHRTPKRRA